MRVELIGVDGAAVGWVMLHQMRDKVVVSGLAQGLTPGFHGFHIDAVGVRDRGADGALRVCSAATTTQRC